MVYIVTLAHRRSPIGDCSSTQLFPCLCSGTTGVTRHSSLPQAEAMVSLWGSTIYKLGVVIQLLK